jgi:alpha-L-fucosidase
MNRKLLLSAAVAAILVSSLMNTSRAASADTPAPTAAAAASTETKEQRDARMAWWREARFGMFIHWGVYSIPAGMWQDKPVTRSGSEWIMNRGKIPVADYQKFPAQFNPVNFNADEWVQIAKSAGMKYIVITAKHHDGFAMYHSKADPFNIYDATPFKRDPLKELAEACRKAGIKLGFYYSQSQDWNHRGGAAAGGYWDKAAQDGSMDDYLDKVAVPQIKELLSNYGPVAVLWWDTPLAAMTPERVAKIQPLLKLQPAIITNNRLDAKKSSGDFETPEQKIPATGIPGKDWETCMTINKTWGFRSYDHDWKSTETLLHNLIDIASKGGNYLLNVGPDATGVIPSPSVERLREIGTWLKVNGTAIYGTTASPIEAPAWGRLTKKTSGDHATIYLHVFTWPKDGKLALNGLKGHVTSATLLASGEKLATSGDEGALTITVPAAAPDPISSTIALQIDGTL